MKRRKDELRGALRGERDRAAGCDPLAAAAAAAHALGIPDFAAAGKVALYAAVGSELSPGPLAENLAGRGVEVIFPRVEGARLSFRAAPVAALRRGAFGILEPSASHPEVRAEELDAIVVPGIAFGRSGARLGWGRGFYDRALRDCPRALRVGFCFAIQVVEGVPMSPEDEPMDWLVTEAGASLCGLPGRVRGA